MVREKWTDILPRYMTFISHMRPILRETRRIILNLDPDLLLDIEVLDKIRQEEEKRNIRKVRALSEFSAMYRTNVYEIIKDFIVKYREDIPIIDIKDYIVEFLYESIDALTVLQNITNPDERNLEQTYLFRLVKFIEEIIFSPSDTQIGDMMTITASIKNQGSSETGNSQVDFYIDGIKIDSQELLSINGEETVTKTFNWVAEAGIHTFKFILDVNNTVIEANETNNEKEQDCTIPTPDLIVEGMSWTMSNQLSNEVTLTITIKNIGTGTARESNVQYSFDESPADIKNITSILAGETFVFSFITILTSGEHTATIVADYDELIEELDEDNNQKIISFSTTTPDLVIRTITYSPLDASIGDTITIAIKLENRGNTTANNVRLALSIDGFIVDHADIEEMDTITPITIEFTWEATEGQHEITVIVDDDQTIAESDESNNSKSRTISFEQPESPVNNAPSTQNTSTNDEGLMEQWWWLLLLIAGLLIVAAFTSTFKLLRKG